MELDQMDFENICEALNQMLFRCERNRNLAEDAFAAGGDSTVRMEAELLETHLQSYSQTLRKAETLRDKKNTTC